MMEQGDERTILELYSKERNEQCYLLMIYSVIAVQFLGTGRDQGMVIYCYRQIFNEVEFSQWVGAIRSRMFRKGQSGASMATPGWL